MDLPKTISSCHQIILDQAKQLEAQGKLILELLAKIADLEAVLNQNSRNSHRPPSSEGYKKKAALPKRKGTKPGGQEGHKGKTLETVQSPDFTEPIRPKVCSCGQDLSDVAMEISARRQVFDLPAPKLEITEYQVYAGQCPGCQAKVEGQFRSAVAGPVQYGPGVKALAGLLNNGHHLSFQSIKELLADMYRYELNEASIQNANQSLYRDLEATEQQIKQHIVQSQVAHLDETGIRVAGKLQWLHVASTAYLTYLFAHPSRGKEALNDEACSILPFYMGTAIHDRLAVYFHYLICFHGLCGAHLLRDLTALIEGESKWAIQMHQLLLDLYQASDKGRSKVSNIKPWRQKYDRICRQARREEPLPEKNSRGRPKKTKGLNLVEQLIEHRSYVLAFAQYEDIPFTNNQAETPITIGVRPAKIKQKIAGSFRTFQGAERFARIRGFISTARKQSRNVFSELANILQGNSFVLNLTWKDT